MSTPTDSDRTPPRPSQYAVVVEGIQEMILSQELGPGDRLPVEPVLAQRFSVSRGSLREGVRALVAMGILETRQGSGTTVTSLDPHLLLQPLIFWASIQEGKSSRDLHTVRKALEVESAGSAALQRTDLDIQQLQAILDEAQPAIESLNHTAAMDLDLTFHLTLAKISGNPILVALLDSLSRPSLRVRMWQSIHLSGRLQNTHNEHMAILKAVAAGDPTSARAAMQTHLMQVIDDVDRRSPQD